MVEVSIMTEQQLSKYGHFHESPNQEQLEKYFFLNETDQVFLSLLRNSLKVLGKY
jgi:hypothetical protein